MATVHVQPAYQMEVKLPPPAGYPQAWRPGERIDQPWGDFPSRREALLAHIGRHAAPNNTKMAYYELARWAAGGTPHAGVFHAAMDFIEARKDCSDFVLHSILRLLYQFQGVEAGELTDEQVAAIVARGRATVLGFKYWPDEAGSDSLCTWTENHHILFASAAYLAGQMFPEEVFPNSGQSGQEKMMANRRRILRWLELRFRTGFSEWLSHVYYDEDLTALLALVDFCRDEEISARAAMVIDLILLDMALNSFKGVFGATHGRAYENTKKWAANEGTADTMWLLFGMGQISGFDCMSAINFALSPNYKMPPVIEAIAQDAARPAMENRQRMGIRLAEAERWGISPDLRPGERAASFEDGMALLTLEAYVHPRTIELTMQMFDAFRWWQNDFFAPFRPYRRLLTLLRRLRLIKPLARTMAWDFCRNTREEVNIVTYRTPDTMLSCAQAYRPGYGGDQQHIWQATLGADAVCFTTHPAKIAGATPNYWAGSGQLPRAAQCKNVLICIYNLHRKPALYVPTKLLYTHAWLPKDQFDEVVEAGLWICARKGNGYLALRSQRLTYWNKGGRAGDGVQRRYEAEDVERELIAPGSKNIWICELGRREVDGPFDAFVQRVSGAPLEFGENWVRYESPSQGVLRFGWDEPFTVDGQEIALRDYPRFDNPYTETGEFGSRYYRFAHEGVSLTLDFVEGIRSSEGGRH